ncbi:MAG TPA: T9SS type A sorting domain-containing protein [Saprospiraceae bacterium]|nr:T9SS type A sorting domain-containing protein [Saprospiraceae bacterium]
MARMTFILLIFLYLVGGLWAQPSAVNIDMNPVKGQLKTDLGSGVENAKIIIEDADGSLLPILVSSDASGGFLIPTVVGSDFLVRPQKDGDVGNGVDIWDLFELENALTTQNFRSSYQKLAADINDDGRVDDQDVKILRHFVLGAPTEFEKQASWRFYDAMCLPPTSAPFHTCSTTKQYLTNNPSVHNLDFVAVKVGDLNNSALSNSQRPIAHVYGEVLLNTPNKRLLPGLEYEIPIEISYEDLVACQWALSLGDLELLDVEESGHSILDQVRLHKNVLYFGHVGKVPRQLLTLKVRARHKALLSDVLSLASERMRPMAYDEEEEVYNINFAFDGKTPHKLTLYQNEPNPFGEETIIRFYLPESTVATLTVYDLNGRVLKTIQAFYEKGMNSISIAKSDLNSSGIYFYKLETNNQSAFRKMLLL